MRSGTYRGDIRKQKKKKCILAFGARSGPLQHRVYCRAKCENRNTGETTTKGKKTLVDYWCVDDEAFHKARKSKINIISKRCTFINSGVNRCVILYEHPRGKKPKSVVTRRVPAVGDSRFVPEGTSRDFCQIRLVRLRDTSLHKKIHHRRRPRVNLLSECSQHPTYFSALLSINNTGIHFTVVLFLLKVAAGHTDVSVTLTKNPLSDRMFSGQKILARGLASTCLYVEIVPDKYFQQVLIRTPLDAIDNGRFPSKRLHQIDYNKDPLASPSIYNHKVIHSKKNKQNQ